MIPSIGFVGYSNSGKTTVVAALIKILSQKGYRVAAIKHASHGYDLDVPGKDSWQHFQAGAQKVIVVGPDAMSVHQHLEREPLLAEILATIENVDLILIEGYKNEPGPKVEIVREKESPRVGLKGNLLAVVSDSPIPEEVPCFPSDQLDELAEFLIANYFPDDRG
ncbi:MAG TPA: molybdopterin-guanine dinucleotide biosynthesis protein B [Syntrophomonadaceae bacterium]|nr:molybdopterin-guanine dinucleotide biosynthesis protein B [Syntrophomonadaceae bacterium]